MLHKLTTIGIISKAFTTRVTRKITSFGCGPDHIARKIRRFDRNCLELLQNEEEHRDVWKINFF